MTGQLVLQELRQRVLAALLGNPLFSAAEQLQANHLVHECQDAARLTRWLANVRALLARRQAAAARARCRLAWQAILRQLLPPGLRTCRPRRPQPLPTWVPGAFLPDRADRPAGTFDRRAAAHFRPADSQSLAHRLPSCWS